MEWLVPLVLATGVAAPALHRALGRASSACLAVLPAFVALRAALAQTGVAGGAYESFRIPWVPTLGIDWAFRVDGLSNLFVLLVAGIGAIVVLYAGAYLRDDPRLGRFYAFLLVFMGAMLGLVTADDLVLLFVFWELTTVSSFLLIGFKHEKGAARDAAVQSLLVTGAGGLALLAGLVLLASAAGTTSLSGVVAQGDAIRADPRYPWILGLVLAGAFTKSAQVPFHFWLPAAMQAPTPVSAYLHSSTMVKAGVFLLARLSPALGGTEAWLVLLGSVGALTMLCGAVASTVQDDLKRVLAHSTVAVLGLLVMLLGLGTPIAARAFAVTLLAHALYKATLFLVAGNVDLAAGTRSLARLGGLRPVVPWSAGAALVAGISMAGAPPLFGFLAKETAYEAALEAPRFAWAFGPVTVAAAVCLVFAALRVALGPFVGSPVQPAQASRARSRALHAGPVLLAGAGMFAGLLIGPAERLWIAPTARAVLQAEAPTGLALWHGFTPILLLSLATLASGIALFRFREKWLSHARLPASLAHLGPTRLWDGAWQGLLDLAAWQTRLLQNGSLTRYLACTLATVFAAALFGLASGATLPDTWSWGPPLTPIGVAAILLVVGGSLAMPLAKGPLPAVAALGAAGFGVALLFLVYSAPDLALTQLVVEVLTVVLLVFVIPRLPRPALRRRRVHPAALIVACIGGATMAALTLLAFQPSGVEPVSAFFEARSVPDAHGRNVVNVILVDFRALDTLGEITVLAIAAFGILALLDRRRANAPPEAGA